MRYCLSGAQGCQAYTAPDLHPALGLRTPTKFIYDGPTKRLRSAQVILYLMLAGSNLLITVFPELELGEGIINEARHHPRNLVPMVYRACDAEQQDCAIMAECWLSVSFSAPSHFPAMIFPLPTKQLYPISTLYMRELTLTG